MRPATKVTAIDGFPAAQPTRRLTPGEARRWLVRHGGEFARQPNARAAEVAENATGYWGEWSCRFSGWPQGHVNPLWYGVMTRRQAIAV